MSHKSITNNTLFYGDNLPILRDHIANASVDLVNLDPPLNSNRSYSIIFREHDGHLSEAQIRASEDTWHQCRAVGRGLRQAMRIADLRPVVPPAPPPHHPGPLRRERWPASAHGLRHLQTAPAASGRPGSRRWRAHRGTGWAGGKLLPNEHGSLNIRGRVHPALLGADAHPARSRPLHRASEADSGLKGGSRQRLVSESGVRGVGRRAGRTAAVRVDARQRRLDGPGEGAMSGGHPACLVFSNINSYTFLTALDRISSAVLVQEKGAAS